MTYLHVRHPARDFLWEALRRFSFAPEGMMELTPVISPRTFGEADSEYGLRSSRRFYRTPLLFF